MLGERAGAVDGGKGAIVDKQFAVHNYCNALTVNYSQASEFRQ
jgi:hypothetical protein